jgi:branched-chain amino acid transport system ATP-binding protein
MLDVDDLRAGYGDIAVLRGVSLSVTRGEIVTVVGANGAGKTTLLRTISGLIRPSAGRIVYDGVPITGLRPDVIVGRGLIHCPEGRGMLKRMTVRENLELGAYRLGRGDRSAALERVFSLFPKLQERQAQHAGLLSGGEQQMLAIGRALMAEPRLLILDEPSLGLSPLLVTQIFRIIRRINEEQGVAILLVEQNAHMALRTAQFGYVLEVGRIVLADDCNSLMQTDAIKEFYLGQKEAGIRGQRRYKRKRLWH